jgi:hypothetical protein
VGAAGFFAGGAFFAGGVFVRGAGFAGAAVLFLVGWDRFLVAAPPTAAAGGAFRLFVLVALVGAVVLVPFFFPAAFAVVAVAVSVSVGGGSCLMASVYDA